MDVDGAGDGVLGGGGEGVCHGRRKSNDHEFLAIWEAPIMEEDAGGGETTVTKTCCWSLFSASNGAFSEPSFNSELTRVTFSS